jgi:orotidine-5'-phosphate decarboxylase
VKSPIIIALDFSKRESVCQFLSRVKGESLSVKVGMELFYQTGPEFISELKQQGHEIFLDLKLHDIPNTVKKAMKGLAALDVDIVNVHAAGGREMMEAAIEGLDEGTPSGKKRPLCIAVTQLTSTSQETMQRDLLIPEKIEDVVASYAQLAEGSGMDGVVCSPLETPFIKKVTRADFITVTPGIRMKDDDKSDQKRIATPQEAKKFGSDYIVVGRSITNAADPVFAYEQIKADWSGKRERTNHPSST